MNENLSHPLSNTPVGAATVAVRRRWYAAFQLVGAVVGALSAFVIGPIVGWLLSLIGDAPGPLRLAAELPLAWAIPALAILGAIVGLVLVAQWHEDAGTVLIDGRGITVADKDGKQRVLREDIQSIFTDGKDLIIDDLSGHERLRKKADDELATQLPAVLKNFDYRYLGTNDPQEAEFAEWVDG
ncbi:YqeB family protein [Corynebacterium sp. A21]|uniref:YqeB family protein n=1 Tax=Corynebacterium sp. A21 TaxID=3457318 RepID=UPI003FD54EF5